MCGYHAVHLPCAVIACESLLQQEVSCGTAECQRHATRREFLLQQAQFLVEDEFCHVAVHLVEHHDARQTVYELRLEGLFHLFQHCLTLSDAPSEAYRRLRCKLCAGVAGHYHHHVAEVGLSPAVVGKARIVHHLQQNVVDVGMRLLYLVQEQHAVGTLAYGIRQQSAVLIAHISCWRADEFRHSVLLGVFAHVEAHQFDAHLLCQNARHLGLADTRRTHEEQRCERFVVVQQSGTCHLHRLNYLRHRLLLTVNLTLDALAQCCHAVVVVVALHRHGVHLAHLGNDFRHQSLGHLLLLAPALHGVQFAICASLVDNVNRLVGKEAVVDILCACRNGIFHCLVGICHVVERLIARQQSAYYLHRLVCCWFVDVYLLEASHYALRLREILVELLVCRASDEAQVALLHVWLEDVRGIERAFNFSRAHDVVYLVDVYNRCGGLRSPLHHVFQAFLEVAPELCSRHHGAHVHHEYPAATQTFGHIAAVDACRQTIYESRLAHSCLTHMQRVVLVLAAQHLYGAFQFALSAYQRVVAFNDIIEAGDIFLPLLLLPLLSVALLEIIVIVCLVRQQHLHFPEHGIEISAESLLQQICRPRILKVQYAPQNQRYVDVLNAVSLADVRYVEYHRVHLSREVGHEAVLVLHLLDVADKGLEFLFQLFGIAVRLNALRERCGAQHRQQQVLRSDVLVMALLCDVHRVAHGSFYFCVQFDFHCRFSFLLFLFVVNLQRESLFPRHFSHLFHPCHCHVEGVNAHYCLSLVVHFQHQFCGCCLVLVKHLRQHAHDKLHRGDVVVEENHAVSVRLFQFDGGVLLYSGR